MPHLAWLQSEYKEKGVTIIGFTCRDIRGGPDNSARDVTAFLAKCGSEFKYSFAYSDNAAAADAWLKGQESTFRTFVVEKTGRIAYAGHPIFLDVVLPKAVAGDQSAETIGEQMAKVEADYRMLLKILEHDQDAGLRALTEFETNYPPLADLAPIMPVKLTEMSKRGTPRQTKEYAEAIVAKAIKRNDAVSLELVCMVLRNASDSKELLAIAVKAAEARVRLNGRRDAQSLLNLAETYFVSGDKAKATKCIHEAITAAAGESVEFQQHVEEEAQRIARENEARE